MIEPNHYPNLWLKWASIGQLTHLANTDKPRWLAWQVDKTLILGPRLGVQASGCVSCLCRRLASHGLGEPLPLIPETVDASLVCEGMQQLQNTLADDLDLLSWNFEKGWQWHRLLPVPGCSCTKQVIRVSSTIKKACSPYVGIVAAVTTWFESGLEANQQSSLVFSKGCDVRALGSVAGEITGAAYGQVEQATTASIAEVLERYCAGFIPLDLPTCRAHELGEPYLAIMPEAFRGAALGSDNLVRWVRGTRLVNGEPCWVQAASVYFPYVCHDAEPRSSTGSSEGLAAGASWDAAVEHAAFELIERDSFMRSWRYNSKHFALPNFYPNRQDLSFTLIDNRFGVPVVSAFSELNEIPYCVAGLAARRTIKDAVEASAREALGARSLFCRVNRQRRNLESRYHHAVNASLTSIRQHWKSVELADSSTHRIYLDWMSFVRRVPDAIAVDITTPDVLSLGIRVARVVIPGCHGFEPVPGLTRLGGSPWPIPY